MKVLCCSRVFALSIGGVETVGRIPAEEFSHCDQPSSLGFSFGDRHAQ